MNKNIISPLNLMEVMEQMFDDLGVGSNGVEELFQNKKNYTNYPPSNIIEYNNEIKPYWEIQLALAGWDKEDIAISIENKETLKIVGTKKLKICETEKIRLIHKGIADRNFEKGYSFTQQIEKVDIELECGILYVMVSLKEQIDEIKVIDWKKK
jgi:molecular chaperone IbpA